MLSRTLHRVTCFPYAISSIHTSTQYLKDQRLYKLHGNIHPNDIQYKAKQIIQHTLKGHTVKVKILPSRRITEEEMKSTLSTAIELIEKCAEEAEVKVKIQKKNSELDIFQVPEETVT